MTTQVEEWTASYGGGRLAEIYYRDARVALECLQVVDYDWTGTPGPLTRESLRAQLRRWIDDHAAECLRGNYTDAELKEMHA